MSLRHCGWPRAGVHTRNAARERGIALVRQKQLASGGTRRWRESKTGQSRLGSLARSIDASLRDEVTASAAEIAVVILWMAICVFLVSGSKLPLQVKGGCAVLLAPPLQAGTSAPLRPAARLPDSRFCWARARSCLRRVRSRRLPSLCFPSGYPSAHARPYWLFQR